MKIEVCAREKCTGCGLCAAICPRHAISMEYSEEGFQYPQINNNLCIDCNLCSRKCIANNEPRLNNDKFDYYLAWNNNPDQRQEGSSGGLFYILAENFIKNGGVVCGAKLENPHYLHHVIISETKQISALCGSKYIPSEASEVYQQVKEILNEGKKVLFVGTPCQVDALYGLCGDHKLLYTCDLVCYGVGSKTIWDEYILLLEQRYKSPCTEVYFRKKKYGCRNASFYATFQNGKHFDEIFYISEYGELFSKKWIGRIACYNCQYAVRKRISDITLGDYTGLDLYKESYSNIKQGVSLLRINTEKGNNLVNYSEKQITKKEREENFILKSAVRQKEFVVSEDHTKRDMVMKDFTQNGLIYILNKYHSVSKKAYQNYRYDTVRLYLKKVYRWVKRRGVD